MEQQTIIFTVTNDLNTDQRMQRICRSMHKLGYDVLLVGRHRPASQPLVPQPFRQHRIRCMFGKGALFYAEYNLRLLFFLLRSRCSVISAVDADTLLACALASGKNKKLAFDAHEYFTEVPELTGRSRVKKIWQRILDYGIRKASVCYTVGPELAAIFSAQYNKPFGVVYNMPERKPPAEKSSSRIILYQGDLNEGRGLFETIDAIKDIDAEFHIAGDGLLREELERYVAQQGMLHKVILLGKIPPAQLHEITLKAAIGINVLDAVSLSYRYSVANKFFDYVQAGVPVVCAGFIEYRKLNREFEVAVLCDHEPGAIGHAIKLLLSDEQHYKKLAENCKLAAAQWHWATQEPKLAALYAGIRKRS